LRNIKINTSNPAPNSGVGIYVGAGADHLIIDNVDMNLAPADNDYGYRGNAKKITSLDSTYMNQNGKGTFRAYGVTSGSSTRDTFIGGTMWLGGGAGNGWENQLNFDNFTFRDGRIDVSSVEIMDETDNVVFENMDFSGTHHISIQGGASNITFRNCTNIPEIRKYGNPQNVQIIND
jgi:hypothetical protein